MRAVITATVIMACTSATFADVVKQFRNRGEKLHERCYCGPDLLPFGNYKECCHAGNHLRQQERREP